MIDVYLNGGHTGLEAVHQADCDMLGRGAEERPSSYLAQCPIHQQTPLRELPGLAASLGIRSLYVKDESTRLNLGSFKALGGAYAAFRLVHDVATEALGRPIGTHELRNPDVRAIAETMTFICATDGNHGRSLAAGARLLGAHSVIVVHERVSAARVDAIRAAGARIIVCNGDYDDAVEYARTLATENNWTLVSDTSWPGYETIPRTVMQGYTVAAAETWSQLTELGVKPTHILLQAGVGGFAAAVALHAATNWPENPPSLIVVEPDRAACLKASAAAGRMARVPHHDSTIMAMLECFEPSMIAFDILKALAGAFVTIDDSWAIAAMRRFAIPIASDPNIISGESGAAGMGALLAIADDPAAAKSLAIDRSSRILLFNTEGATDMQSYQALALSKANPL